MCAAGQTLSQCDGLATMFGGANDTAPAQPLTRSVAEMMYVGDGVHRSMPKMFCECAKRFCVFVGCSLKGRDVVCLPCDVLAAA